MLDKSFLPLFRTIPPPPFYFIYLKTTSPFPNGTPMFWTIGGIFISIVMPSFVTPFLSL